MLAYSNPVYRLGMQRFAWTPITFQPVSHDNVIDSNISNSLSSKQKYRQQQQQQQQ